MVLPRAYPTGGGTMTGPQIITAIGADGVTNTEIASTANTIKGDIGAGLADLTAAQARHSFLAPYDDFAAYLVWDANTNQITGASETAINSGTGTFVVDDFWGNAYEVLTAVAATDDSGRIFGLGSNNTAFAVNKEVFGAFRTPVDLSDVLMRCGVGNWNTVNTGGNACYFELIGSTFSMVNELVGVRTTHATTLAAVADTPYFWRIRRNASDVTFTLYNGTTRAVILTGTQGGMLGATTACRAAYQWFHDAVDGAGAEALGRIYRLGTKMAA